MPNERVSEITDDIEILKNEMDTTIEKIVKSDKELIKLGENTSGFIEFDERLEKLKMDVKNLKMVEKQQRKIEKLEEKREEILKEIQLRMERDKKRRERSDKKRKK